MATIDAIFEELQDQGARTIRLIEALQASNERQRESNELLRSRLGAATGSDPSALAGAGETSTPASLHAPDSPGPLKSYSHGNHVPVPVEADERVQVVPISKTSNGMPFVEFSTVKETKGDLIDLLTGEPYSYVESLKRARSAFPQMLASAMGDPEEVELLQDMSPEPP